ncbi:hypothetical protein JOD43_002312 [Pullulanibacillus pueri]|nr:hypothetical protein [Pullulanibacillus pueri]
MVSHLFPLIMAKRLKMTPEKTSMISAGYLSIPIPTMKMATEMMIGIRAKPREGSLTS